MDRHVMLCDDEIHILRAAEFKLKRAGYVTTCAGDGQEAWELIQNQVPDLLIVDCQMPRMSGPELCERLRQWEPTRELPIFMLTAKGYEIADAEFLEELKIRQLILKPFSPRDLLAKVDQLLRPEVVEPSAASG